LSDHPLDDVNQSVQSLVGCPCVLTPGCDLLAVSCDLLTISNNLAFMNFSDGQQSADTVGIAVLCFSQGIEFLPKSLLPDQQ
jgi:hypothetical protein